MIANLVIGAIILAALFFAVRSVIKQNKKGGCGCGCSACDCPDFPDCKSKPE